WASEMREMQQWSWNSNAEDTFIWLESIQANTAGEEWDMEQFIQEDSFVGDLLRYSDRLRQDDQALQSWAEQALEPMRGSMKWRQILDGTSGDKWTEWLRDAEDRALQLLLLEGDRSREN